MLEIKIKILKNKGLNISYDFDDKKANEEEKSLHQKLKEAIFRTLFGETIEKQIDELNYSSTKKQKKEK